MRRCQTSVLDPFRAGVARERERRQHARPVVGRPIGQAQRHAIARRIVGAALLRGAERAGRPAEQLAEGLVEAAHAAEARGQRHLGHRQARVVHQLLGEQHAPRLGDGDRRGAEMLLEQPPQLAAADAQPLGQRLDVGIARRRARPRRSAPARGSPCWPCRARRRGRARSRAGSAGRAGNPPPGRRRPRRRSGSSRTSACAPGRSAGSRCRSRSRRRRCGRRSGHRGSGRRGSRFCGRAIP